MATQRRRSSAVHSVDYPIPFNRSSGSPQIEVLHKPQSHIRFRYETEKDAHGCFHGCLEAEGKGKTKKKTKSYPKIKVHNYKFRGIIRVSLWSEYGSMPHFHRIVGNKGSLGFNEKSGLYEVPFDPNCPEIFLQNINIISSKKKDQKQVLKERYDIGHGCLNETPSSLEKKIDPLRVVLKFELFDENELQLCFNYSNVINHQKSQLRITELSHFSYTYKGNGYILMFTNEIKKEDIKVFFYKDITDNDGNSLRIWEIEATIEVPNKYGIKCKVPPYYPDRILEEDKPVSIALYQPSTDQWSEGRDFLYKCDDDDHIKRKKAKTVTEFQSGSFPVVQMVPFAGSSVGVTTEQPHLSAAAPPNPVTAAAEQVVPGLNPLPEEFLSLKDLDMNIPDHILFEAMGTLSNLSPDVECDAVPVTSSKTKSISDKPAYVAQSPAATRQSTTQTGTELVRLASNVAQSLQAYSRSGDVTSLLLPMRQLVGVLDENGDNALHLSVIHSQPDTLNLLLDVIQPVNGLDIQHLTKLDMVNTYNSLKQTPLHLAVFTNQPTAVKSLLKKGGNPNFLNSYGNSVLHMAAQAGSHKELIELLNKDNYPPNSTHLPLLNALSHQGATALHLAVQNHHLECIRLLVSAGADCDIGEGTSGRTALHIAVEERLTNVIQLLLEQGKADYNYQSYDGNTPLHVAASLEPAYLEGMKLLLEAGADTLIENYEVKQDEVDSEDSDELEVVGHRPKNEEDSEDSDELKVVGHRPKDLTSDHQVIKLLEEYRISQVAKSPADTKLDDDELDLGTDSGIGLSGISISSNLSSGNISSASLSSVSIKGSGKAPELDSGLGFDNSKAGDARRSFINSKLRDELKRLLDPPSTKWQDLVSILDIDASTMGKLQSPTDFILNKVKDVQQLEFGIDALGLEVGIRDLTLQ